MNRLFLIGCTLTVLSCSSSKKATTDNIVVRQLPRFDYAVQNTSKVGSSNITIALVNPTYLDKNVANDVSPLPEMAKGMGNDFEELLTAKGFKIRGPFNDMGSMLYTDKKNSDFIFAVEIDLNHTGTSQYKEKRKINWTGALSGTTTDAGIYSYTFTGKGSMGGSLNLTAMSPSFGEKLWKKSIELQRIPYEFVGTTRWSNTNVTMYDHIKQDPAVYNVIVRLLERMYAETFKLIEAQIDVEEMKTVAAEAKNAEKKN